MVDYDGKVDRFCTTFFAIPYQALLFFILILPVQEQQDYLKRCTNRAVVRQETKQNKMVKQSETGSHIA